MNKCILLVGPPGSGKSTLAKTYESEGYEYVNQDLQNKEHLNIFTSAVMFGRNVIVDRLNFSKQQRDRYLEPAKKAGYETEIIVLHEPYKVCLERCLTRTDHLTIKDEKSARSALGMFFSKYERVQDNEGDKVTRVWPKGEKPSAIIFDLDGTLCNVDHRLHFVRKPKGERKDWKGFFDNILGDSVNKWCADILRKMTEDHTIVYCSGRPDNHRKETVQWLMENDLHSINDPCPEDMYGRSEYFHLYMRPRNDSREDSIIKETLLDFEILTRFTPYFMIDDRARVVDMWRSRGFTCLACAKGDF